VRIPSLPKRKYLPLLMALILLSIPSMGQGSGNLLPDLTIKDVSVSTGIKPGMTAEIVVKFTNVGDDDAGPFSLFGYAFNVGDYQYMLKSEVPISGLKGGETQTKTLTIAVPPDAPSGPWDVQVAIDNQDYSGQGSVVEENENNNEKWVRNIAEPSQETGVPQEVTFQVYRTITTDQGSWKQNCNHYDLAVIKDGAPVELGTGGGVAEETNGALTVYLPPGDYSYKINYRYPGSDQIPMQEGKTEGEFTVTDGRLSLVEVDTALASAPTPTSIELMTTIMHPTKAMLLLEDKIFNSTPEAPEAAAIKPHLTVQQYNAASGNSFSLLDYLSYNPHERSQGKCGNCWEWTSTGIMEIALDYKNGIKDRLSVQYLNSNMENDACCGGSIYKAAEFYENSKKAIPWENNNAQWQDQSSDCGSSIIPASYISTSKNYPIDSINLEKIITQGVGKETAIEKIKAVLQSGKAIYFSFRLPNDVEWSKFQNDFWMGQSENSVWKPDLVCGTDYDEKNGGGGHAVLCVGYDDTNPNNRYWIMLNSWGAPPGRPNGLFHVDMDMNYDCTLSEVNAFNFWTVDINYDLPAAEQASYSENISGIGSIKKDYYILDKSNDYAKVSVDIRNATHYEYRYGIRSEQMRCIADLDLVVEHAESIICSGEAKNRSNAHTDITTFIQNGNLTYNSSVIASNRSVQASQEIIEASGDDISAVGTASDDGNGMIAQNIISANSSESIQSSQEISIGSEASTIARIAATTGPLKVSSYARDGERKLNITADIEAGEMLISQLINLTCAEQDFSGIVGEARFDTAATDTDNKRKRAYTSIGSGSLDLAQLASWKDARYDVAYEYMPVSYSTGVYDRGYIEGGSEVLSDKSLTSKVSSESCESMDISHVADLSEDPLMSTRLDATTGPLEVESNMGDGGRKLNAKAIVEAGEVSISQLINLTMARQDFSGIVGGARFDTAATDTDNKRKRAYTSIGSGSLDLIHLASWVDAHYDAEYEYMPVSYQTGTYDMDANSSKIERN
jgi:C1A family cysteine protease